MTDLPTTRKDRRAWHERVLRDNSPRWEHMNPAERSLFVAESAEAHHRREYEGALAFVRRTGPDWDDLTDEQRERIRKANHEHARDMQELGEAIRKGASA